MVRFLIRILFLLVVCAPYGILAVLLWSDLSDKADLIRVSKQKLNRYSKVVEQIDANDPEMPYFRQDQGLVANYVRSEVLYREALSYGLDKDDERIKQRLAEKMYVYFLEIARNKVKVSRKDVLTYFREHKDDYYLPAKLSFAHVYYGSQNKDLTLIEALAVEKLAELNLNAEMYSNAANHGDKFPSQAIYRLVGREDIINTFGVDFAEQIEKLGVVPNHWSGPILSRHGFHLVTMVERLEGRYPMLEEVETRVRRDTEQHLLKVAVDRELAKLQADYSIALDEALPEPLLAKFRR